MKRHVLTFCVASLLLVMTGFAGAQDNAPASDGQAITIYNEGSALVQDRRTFSFEAGSNIINFTDVAASIDPTSVNFTSLTDPEGTIVLEQNYVYDLVNSSALLERYLDETIQITTEDGTVYTGALLSGREGAAILQLDSGEVVVIQIDKARDVRFPELPDGLITRPTLRWLLNSADGGQQQVELTYLTYGMSWEADYNILLGTDNKTLDLNGWVTLDNRSGATYTDALLKLVAGDVNRLPEPEARGFAMDEEIMMEAMPTVPAVEQREFFEYQLYEVGRPVTIADNETKQVEFVTGTGISADTFFVYDGSPSAYGYRSLISDQYYGETGITDVGNYLEFSTGEESGLGADLPAGNVRVYQEDIDGAALLIGENSIDHTPEGESVRLYLGNAFDLVGERTQVDFQIITDRVIREAWEIRLRNRKDAETVQIRVPERLFRWSNWEILNNSHPYEQLNASTIEFQVDVPPGEEVVITYAVQYSWPR